MDRIVIAESWERYFADLNLRSFDDLYHYPETVTVNQNQKRDVLKLTLGRGAEANVFFMKRFHDPHFKDIWAARRRCDALTSQAAVEWRNARFLLSNGIGTYEPVCIGERTRWGLEKASLFLTRQLDAVCLLDLVLHHWKDLGRTRQEEILTAVGLFAKTLHNLDISLPDLQIWHLYLHPDTSCGHTRLSVIDLHRMTRDVHSTRRKARDLGRLLWSMRPQYFDEGHRQLLLTTYFTDQNGSHREKMTRQIERFEAIFNHRHTADRYYRSTPSPSVSA